MSGLPTGASPPAACHVLIAPGSPHGVLTTSGVCAQPESVAAPKCCPFPSWAFAPPSRLGLSGLTMRATAWHPLMTLARGSRRLLTGGSSAGPSASPPRGAVPTALAIGLPPWRFWPASRGVATTGRLGLAYAPAKQAARSLSGLPYKVFPACCPLSHLAVVPLPPRCFAHPRGFEFSRRPLRW